MSKPPPPTLHLPSTQAYNRWASTYDTDGNILPALDTHALFTVLFPRLVHSLSEFTCSQRRSTNDFPALRIIDLGCGTGRVTRCLLAFLQQAPSSSSHDLVVDLFIDPDAESSNTGGGGRGGGGGPIPRELHITGLDASTGMLDVAKGRVKGVERIEVVGRNPDNNPTVQKTSVAVKTAFHQYDILAPPSDTEGFPAGFSSSTGEETGDEARGGGEGDALICSLVIEHLPYLDTFFRNVATPRGGSGLLKVGGLLILTNMHPDMARGAEPGKANSSRSPAEAAAHVDVDDAVDAVSGVGMAPNASGAGFTDTVTGGKIRVKESYAHSIDDVVVAAEKVGFEVIDEVEERGVEQWMIDHGIVDAQRGRKWRAGGVKCWFGMVLRLARGLEE